MKTMQLILIILFSSQAMAEPKYKDSDLNLTEAQKEQMQVVKQNMHEQIEAARVEIQQQAHAEMANFLTAEQMQQVESRQLQSKEHKGMRKHQRGMQKTRKGAHKEACESE